MATLKYFDGTLYLEESSWEQFVKNTKDSPMMRRCLYLIDNTDGRSTTKSVLSLFDVMHDKLSQYNDTTIIAKNINPWIMLVNNRLVIYFGEDRPIIKSKTVKRSTKHYREWMGNIWRCAKIRPTYYYADVKEPGKVFIFSNTYKFYVEDQGHEVVEKRDGQYIIRFDMIEDVYKELMKKKIQESILKEKQRREAAEELERRKATPGYCSRCGAENADYIPNPYNVEMYDDYTQEWLCRDCYNDLLMDI